MSDRKIFAGSRVRRLRESLQLSQAAMARTLEISPSYLNLVERNQRPLTATLLLKLAETYDLDLRELSGETEARLAAELTEALADPVFGGKMPPRAEIMQTAESSPALLQSFLALYRGYLRAGRAETQAGDAEQPAARPAPEADELFPIDEVRDYFNARSNYIAELDTAAEQFGASLGHPDDLFGALRAHLRDRHGIRLSILPMHAMPDTLRRYDRHNNRLFLSELLAPSSRVFQAAIHVALVDHEALLDRLIAEATLSSDEARRLCRIGLANYFAGALVMPYEAFLDAAVRLRYDLTLLARRFSTSIEQVAHRLTTLQRGGRSGIPFFLLRIDNAGNVSKRFSAGGFHFARSGGACPRWRIHDAFAQPGQTLVQAVELPNGAKYLTLSCTVDAAPVPYPGAPRKLAISLGCEISYASQLVYGEGLDLGNPAAVTPIGVTCRLCERVNCPARAHPPAAHPLVIDPMKKSVSAFDFG